MELNEIIAKAVRAKTGLCWCKCPHRCRFVHGTLTCSRCYLPPIPQYDSDLNAIHEAVETLCDTVGTKHEFNLRLDEQVPVKHLNSDVHKFDRRNATAEQKALALKPIAVEILNGSDIDVVTKGE